MISVNYFMASVYTIFVAFTVGAAVAAAAAVTATTRGALEADIVSLKLSLFDNSYLKIKRTYGDWWHEDG